MSTLLERRFRLSYYGTNARTEFVAGLTTFLALAYIMVVNPAILSQTGIPAGAVMIATCLAAAIGTLVMALYANVPFAQAPGMGLNAFFTFTVVFGLGFSWQQALAMVFLCGIVNIIIVFTKARQKIINAIPRQLQLAIGAGIGAFVAYIGIKNAGLINFTLDPGTYLVLGDGNPATSTIIGGAGAVPGIVAFNTIPLVLAVLSILLMVVLVVKKAPAAILLGIGIATVVGIPFGMVTFDLPAYFATLGGTFNEFGSVVGQAVVAIPSLFSDPAKILTVLATIFAMSLTDTLDTVGTLIGAGGKLFSKEDIAGTGGDGRFKRAVEADGLATLPGALLGTSNTTTFIESGAGIGAGGRTGLASVWTTIFLLASILLAPLALAVPAYATAPALIIVGFLMFEPLMEVKLQDPAIAIPAGFTIIMMVAAYSITEGIAFGFVSYCLVRLFQSRQERIDSGGETDDGSFNPVLVVITVLLLLHFIFTALL